MNKTIFDRNENKRIQLSLPVLFCGSLFSSWQMGVVYFSVNALSVSSRTPLPELAERMNMIVAAGYLLSFIFILILPRLSVAATRGAIGVALACGILIMLPGLDSYVLPLYYIESFCCIFMIGTTISIIVNLYKEETGIKDVVITMFSTGILVSVLQNEFVPLSFMMFKVITVLILLALMFFYCRIPTKVWPEYISLRECLARPKGVSIGIFLLIFLSCLMTLFGTSVAESIRHGVTVYYTSMAVCGVCVLILWYFCKISPLRCASALIGIAAVGFGLAIASLYFAVLALPACALLGCGLAAGMLSSYYGIIIAKISPTRFITPAIIVIAIVTVAIHSLILQNLRGDTAMQYIIYGGITLITAVVFLISEPYLIYSLRKSSFKMPQREAVYDGPDVEDNAEGIENLKDSAFDALSGQEIRIAGLILAGYTNSDIKALLGLSINTVKGYRKSLYSKLQIHSRSELFNLAAKGRN